ncbi:MAG: DeoR/GlpR family DNA-binding transcription regulator [Anaerolineaceae bacterium]|nr:DeoR/GlpR family DNA-binding transcription regulator [Anaerolineaceae bacterium]
MKLILSHLEREGQLRVVDAAVLFGVSESTIRLDLQELEESGMVQRTHGGAILTSVSQKGTFKYVSMGLEERLVENRDAKKAIGRMAADLIYDDETIMIDGGSTSRYVAFHLRYKNRLTIVTHIVDIYPDLIGMAGDFRVVLTGGELDQANMILVGEESPDIVSHYRASKAILGMDGISLSLGLTTQDVHAPLKKAMMTYSDQVIIVADSTKLGRVSLVPVATLQEIDILVTDDGAAPHMVKQIETLGVKVLIAPVKN